MSEDKELADLRRTMFGSREDKNTFYANIKSVDDSKRTCVVIDKEDMEYEEVLLYSVVDESLKGFVMIPKVDSMVLVSRIGGSNELYVSMFSEVDKILLTVGEKVEASIDDKELTYTNDKVSLKITGDKVELDADEVVFNGGDNKGLVKIAELTAKINSLVDSFNNHTHTGVITAVSGGSGAPAVGTPGSTQPPTSKAQQLNESDYENDKIKH